MTVKVLHIINDLSRNGGAQRFVIDLISPPPDGYEIRVITLEDTNDFRAEIEAQGVACYVWDRLSLKEKWQLLRWPDLVHGHLFPSIYIALAAFGKKRIQTEHATHNRRRDHAWMKPFEFFLYWRYHTTVCITEQVQHALEAFLPQWKSHYQVILNGIDLSKYPLIAKSRPESDSPIRIGMVGRFHVYKDHPTLIRALALLPAKYELHFAGDGDRREEYQTLVKSLGLDDRVIFHGVRADIPAFLDGVDIYVQSSIVEGFGLAAVEAMAAGLPVLASRVQGMSEVIDNEASLFNVGDEKMLAQMVASLCDDAASYQTSAQYSVSRCQHFTLSAFREQYYDTYQSLVDNKQRLADGKAS
ncbi:glycosyl transferase [Enterovibrio norvegicus FF-33]|uniref:Glycosyl transferase n=1 Tax=Enterovibrio norvegicus FF-454 TaxID=1185651 RepID=A0A1E5BXS3_9GAMM|nr:glycosyltransferase [Enterovibrio norvegicus]OEE57999.1 glycosyl transferase [Enterovibrio norvegicus FF-454]OEE70656.1 glycosyl transferase [Enterovibrio norvegicus FF-33]